MLITDFMDIAFALTGPFYALWYKIYNLYITHKAL